MPWRLIVFIVIFSVFLVFITFNLDNKCDISFGIGKIPEVPVFVTVFTSFVMGLLCALPLVMHIKKKQSNEPLFEPKKKEDDTNDFGNNNDSKTNDCKTDDNIKKDAASARKRFFSGRNRQNND